MRCKECGEKLELGARYCDFCGTPTYKKEEIDKKQSHAIVYEENKTEEKAKPKHKSSSKIGILILVLIVFNIFVKNFMPSEYYHSVKGIVGVIPTAIWFYIIFKIAKAVKRNRG